MIGISVQGDVKELSRDLKAIRASIPRITSRALNELATWGRKEMVDETATELRLPRQVIAKTTRKGEKADRFRILKASPALLMAQLVARSEGIQVTDVAGAWTGRKPGQGGGVKAKGGRFYRGAFKAPVKGRERVWKRRGPARLPIFLPRIGTRSTMLKTFDKYVAGERGTAIFRQRFQRLANLELQRRGFR